MSRRLGATLYVIAAYLAVMGILFLFFPGIAEKVLRGALPDRALNLLYGQLVLTFAYVAFLAANGGEGLRKLSRVVLVLTAGHVVVFVYQLGANVLSFAQAGPPLIINLVFSALLFTFRKDIKA